MFYLSAARRVCWAVALLYHQDCALKVPLPPHQLERKIYVPTFCFITNQQRVRLYITTAPHRGFNLGPKHLYLFALQDNHRKQYNNQDEQTSPTKGFPLYKLLSGFCQKWASIVQLWNCGDQSIVMRRLSKGGGYTLSQVCLASL